VTGPPPQGQGEEGSLQPEKDKVWERGAKEGGKGVRVARKKNDDTGAVEIINSHTRGGSSLQGGEKEEHGGKKKKPLPQLRALVAACTVENKKKKENNAWCPKNQSETFPSRGVWGGVCGGGGGFGGNGINSKGESKEGNEAAWNPGEGHEASASGINLGRRTT